LFTKYRRIFKIKFQQDGCAGQRGADAVKVVFCTSTSTTPARPTQLVDCRNGLIILIKLFVIKHLIDFTDQSILLFPTLID